MNRRGFLMAAGGLALAPVVPVAAGAAPEPELLFVSPHCQAFSTVSMLEQYEQAELLRQIAAGLGHSFEQLRIEVGATAYRKFDGLVRT